MGLQGSTADDPAPGGECRRTRTASQHQGERTWYVYDSAGQRVRKVTERQATAGIDQRDERIYLGGFEIYRAENDGNAVTLERETLHIMDDKQRIALVETRTPGQRPRRRSN